jgi:hypothetical protein
MHSCASSSRTRRPVGVGATATDLEHKNALFKTETLLHALHQFRDGLVAESELAAQRHR